MIKSKTVFMINCLAITVVDYCIVMILRGLPSVAKQKMASYSIDNYY